MTLTKEITWFGRPCLLACDGRCSKAWGHNGRPKVEFDAADPGDYAYLADYEVGVAPANPGTYEGGDAKPTSEMYLLNKWCARECERSAILEGERRQEPEKHLPDFSRRLYNMPSKHKVAP